METCCFKRIVKIARDRPCVCSGERQQIRPLKDLPMHMLHFTVSSYCRCASLWLFIITSSSAGVCSTSHSPSNSLFHGTNVPWTKTKPTHVRLHYKMYMMYCAIQFNIQNYFPYGAEWEWHVSMNVSYLTFLLLRRCRTRVREKLCNYLLLVSHGPGHLGLHLGRRRT